MKKTIAETLSGFGYEVLDRIREDHFSRLDEAAFQESVVGIEKATSALYEARIEEERIIQLLQKYWDLRPSEALYFLDRAKEKDID